MRKISAILFVVTFYSVGTIAAQGGDCAYGLSCDQIPWRVPGMPMLVTPTPFPTELFTSTSTFTPTPNGTPPGYVPTTTANFDMSEIGDQMATLRVVAQGTPIAFQDIGITSDSDAELGAQAGSFFGYIAGLQQVHFGVFTPLMSFALGAMLFVLVIKSAGLIVPIIAAFVGIIRKIIQVALDFIPG